MYQVGLDRINHILGEALSKGLDRVKRPSIDIVYGLPDFTLPNGVKKQVHITVCFSTPPLMDNAIWLDAEPTSDTYKQFYLCNGTDWILSGSYSTPETMFNLPIYYNTVPNNSGSSSDMQIATNAQLGVIKVGFGLAVTGDGTLNMDPPAATTSSIGGVKIGDGLAVSTDGTVSTDPLSWATPTTIGGITLTGDLSGVGNAPTVPALASKQAVLVSGGNIKTVGNKSLLGSGDLGLTPADIGAATSAQGALAATAIQSIPNATTTSTGVVQLTGDLGGTATSPTVPGLANRQVTLISGTNIKTVGGVSLLGSGDVPLPSVSTATTGAVGTVQLAGDLSGTATLPTVPGLASKQSTLISGTNIKTIAGISLLGSGDITLPTTPASTSSSLGTIQLTGDLSGSATAPTVPGLANKQVTLVSGTNIKTVGGTSLLGSGDIPIPMITNATASSVGVIQLTGDLSGTATSPTVPGLSSKQPTLVSGTNIKTIAGTSLLGSGDIAYPTSSSTAAGLIQLTGDLGGTYTNPTVPGLSNKQDILVSGTNIKTVGGTSILGSGDVPFPTVANATTASTGVIQLAGDLSGTASAPTVPGLSSKQATLVSGTNIKTVGSISLLGSGDIPFPTPASATTATLGTIQLAGDLSGTASIPTVPGLANKQATLVSGTNIKTVGGTSILGSGDVPFPVATPTPNATATVPGILQLTGDLSGTYASPTVPGLSSKQATLVSGTNIKTVGGTSILGTGDIPFPVATVTPNATTTSTGVIQLAGDLAGTYSSPTVPGLSNKQTTLVSGTNIKTVGGTSLLGSGDVPFPTVTPTPNATSTVAGTIQLTGDLAGTYSSPTVPGLTTKQATLVSGTNIKTVNSVSLLGSGDIPFPAATPNATSSVPGIIQLTGDLSGTYTSPTVPGLTGKQATLISGTNIKTVGSTSILGSGDIPFPVVPNSTSTTPGLIQLTGDLSGTYSSPTVPGLANKQATLVSGTNIKTVGSTSLLGTGDIPFPTVPSASTTVQGTIQLAGDLSGTAGLPTVPALANKQATLVSGTNIKTVNTNSLLGSGDVHITITSADITDATSAGKTLLTSSLAAQQSALGVPVLTNFVGATTTTSGASGQVPAPNAGDEWKFLCADGTFSSPKPSVSLLSASVAVSLTGVQNISGASLIVNSVSASLSINTAAAMIINILRPGTYEITLSGTANPGLLSIAQVNPCLLTLGTGSAGTAYLNGMRAIGIAATLSTFSLKSVIVITTVGSGGITVQPQLQQTVAVASTYTNLYYRIDRVV